MTTTKIEKRLAVAMNVLTVRFEAAKRIREILDAAKKETGSDEIEQEILDLVTED